MLQYVDDRRTGVRHAACGDGNLRRSYKDFADVVDLIAAHNLNGSLEQSLHESVRKTYRELVRRANSG